MPLLEKIATGQGEATDVQQAHIRSCNFCSGMITRIQEASTFSFRSDLKKLLRRIALPGSIAAALAIIIWLGSSLISPHDAIATAELKQRLARWESFYNHELTQTLRGETKEKLLERIERLESKTIPGLGEVLDIVDILIRQHQNKPDSNKERNRLRDIRNAATAKLKKLVSNDDLSVMQQEIKNLEVNLCNALGDALRLANSL